MKTQELLDIDYRDSYNRYILLQALQKIPPLKNVPDTQLDLTMVQKAIHVMTAKYEMFLRMSLDNKANYKYDVWCCDIYREKDLSKVGTIFGMCVEEILIKAAILLYSEVRKIKRNGNG